MQYFILPYSQDILLSAATNHLVHDDLGRVGRVGLMRRVDHRKSTPARGSGGPQEVHASQGP